MKDNARKHITNHHSRRRRVDLAILRCAGYTRVSEEQGKGEGVICLTSEQEKQIKKLMESTFCLSDFRCYKSRFINLRDMELPDYLECIEISQTLCGYQVSYGCKYYCSCPLAVYAVNNRLWN